MDKKLKTQKLQKMPAAPEIEASLLGSILIDEEAINKITSLLRPEVFYLKEHQVIFQAMLSLIAKNEPVDEVTVYEELKKLKKTEIIGGAVYLSRLSLNISSAANIVYHAKIIYDKFILRKIIAAAKQISSDTTKRILLIL